MNNLRARQIARAFIRTWFLLITDDLGADQLLPYWDNTCRDFAKEFGRDMDPRWGEDG
jgi:hypothetical protein